MSEYNKNRIVLSKIKDLNIRLNKMSSELEKAKSQHYFDKANIEFYRSELKKALQNNKNKNIAIADLKKQLEKENFRNSLEIKMNNEIFSNKFNELVRMQRKILEIEENKFKNLKDVFFKSIEENEKKILNGFEEIAKNNYAKEDEKTIINLLLKLLSDLQNNQNLNQIFRGELKNLLQQFKISFENNSNEKKNNNISQDDKINTNFTEHNAFNEILKRNINNVNKNVLEEIDKEMVYLNKFLGKK